MEEIDNSEPMEDPYETIEQLSTQNQEIQRNNSDMAQSLASSNFSDQAEETLIHYQLETDKILERIEHFLKGDRVSFDNNGNVFYKAPEDEKLKNFNEYGVSELMRVISMYVTKETFLSYYTEERINEILGDLGDALTNFIYCNYEKMGMNTKYKESKYIMIVLNILHTVESCYRRAIGGKEQENIRTRSMVTQNNSGMPGGGRSPMPKKRWSLLDKSTW